MHRGDDRGCRAPARARFSRAGVPASALPRSGIYETLTASIQTRKTNSRGPVPPAAAAALSWLFTDPDSKISNTPGESFRGGATVLAGSADQLVGAGAADRRLCDAERPTRARSRQRGAGRISGSRAGAAPPPQNGDSP